MTFDESVLNAIISNNKFNIESVKNLVYINSRCYVADEYNEIKKMITSGDLKSISDLISNEGTSSEYLYIVIFNDQINNHYVASVYDSDELWQNPTVLEIFPARSFPSCA